MYSYNYVKNTLKLIVCKNDYIMGNAKKKAIPNHVNVNYWDRSSECDDGLGNLGDMLSPIVVNNVLDKYHIDPNTNIKKTTHLYAIGSIISQGFSDATIWGSGFLFDPGDSIETKVKYKMLRKLDVRAVRGPRTKEVFDRLGVKCPALYGDPAVLMPLFYRPNIVEKREYRVVLHFRHETLYNDYLSILTNDYRKFIDDLCSSNLVISGSLHGIILAEAYGIPAVFLQDRPNVYMFKYKDWYESTGRSEFPIARTVEEALQICPPPIPNLQEMQKLLLDTFPADLWR